MRPARSAGRTVFWAQGALALGVMNHWVSYLGIAAAVLMAVIVTGLSSGTTMEYTAPSDIYASSTVSVVPSVRLPELQLPNLIAPSSTAATSTKKTTTTKKVAVKNEPTTPVATSTQSVTIVTQSPYATNAELDASAALVRAALVNIVCYAPAGGPLHSISGSGIIIDEKGVILTNAHVAQYFLLADRGVSCTIRTGNPAQNAYKAALIYISSNWLHANAAVLTQVAPSGTGEFDFALLAITKSVTSSPLPSFFPAIPLATLPPTLGAPVVIASYGAQFLESAQVQSSLFPTIVFGSVKDVLTFGTNTIDVLDLGGSAAAQEGSSGGGVASASGDLVGTITTSTVTGDTSSRSLDAISAAYIRREYAAETGSPLSELLNQATSVSVSGFAARISELEAIITAAL